MDRGAKELNDEDRDVDPPGNHDALATKMMKTIGRRRKSLKDAGIEELGVVGDRKGKEEAREKRGLGCQKEGQAGQESAEEARKGGEAAGGARLPALVPWPF